MEETSLMTSQKYKPPNYPWNPIKDNPSAKAVISYYYSDPNTKTPIRDVSHTNDAKADPNIETKTYGLFSRCNKVMRKSVVTNGVTVQFLCTARKNSIRVLTGYYLLGWFYEVEKGDFMLAAKEVRLVNPGFRLDSLVDYLEGFPIARFFRTWKYIPLNQANKLLTLLKATPNRTNEYLTEINRFSVLSTFTWEDAEYPMKLEKKGSKNND